MVRSEVRPDERPGVDEHRAGAARGREDRRADAVSGAELENRTAAQAAVESGAPYVFLEDVDRVRGVVHRAVAEEAYALPHGIAKRQPCQGELRPEPGPPWQRRHVRCSARQACSM